ncbi:PREDICTED: uncharacterized protein LOC108973568 isoform X2 [Bactrocera latifrons]|uniref:uncharacterized protein LOC108973568 isoform X2 n=1 Tax=Bactrocera latifrons TaxID=174628 RepID=UPI0008DCDDC0|nr:PREDICTED: uncharacterized protein LOC108973568 isoform X2 [Bactrocera latifrons]
MLKSPASRDKFPNKTEHSPVIKQLAIDKMFANMQRRLSLLHHTLICDEEEAYKVETPYKLFSWSNEDFEARLKLDNLVWLKVFIRTMSKSCMGLRKLEIDIEELLEFAKLLHEIFAGQNLRTESIAKKLKSALTLIDLPEIMGTQLKNNAKKNEELCVRVHEKMFTKTDDKNASKKINVLEHIFSESIAYDPIETRYQIRYQNSLVEQFEDRTLIEQNKLQKEIDRYNELMRVEKYCSQCTINALYAETNKYRTRIDELGTQYTKEYDDITNKLAIKRANCEKLRVQRSFLEEEIVRFNEEIANVLRQKKKKSKRLHRSREQSNMESPQPLENKNTKKKTK